MNAHFPLTIAALLATTVAGIAEPVELRSLDGAVALTGELIAAGDGFYTIETTIGAMTIAMNSVLCEGDACPDLPQGAAHYSITGSNTVGAELMPAFIEEWALLRGGDIVRDVDASHELSSLYHVFDDEGNELLNIELNAAGSSTAFRALLAGEAELGMSSRPVRPAEVTAMIDAGMGDPTTAGQESIVALDGILVVTNNANPVSALSLQEIAGVFAGQIDNWAQVGGVDAPVNLYRRDDESGTTGVFTDLVLAPFDAQFASTAQQMESNAAVSDAVAEDAFGIGFTTFANERNARALSIRQSCGLLSPASEFAVRTEEYPLSRRLYVYRSDDALMPEMEAFSQFLVSNAAQPVIADVGFIDQAITARPLAQFGDRFLSAIAQPTVRADLPELQRMGQVLANSARLSTTLRFRFGSSQLDTRAMADLTRLAELIEAGEFDGRTIQFVGFSDAVGLASANQALSRTRAAQAAAILRDQIAPIYADTFTTEVYGFGELTPVGCNDNDAGRATNRRVELWLK